MSESVPRGIRNCNPGNLRRTSDKWLGLREEQTDDEFFQFVEMRWGYRALMKTLRTYRSKYGLRTVKEMIGRFAPASENDTEAYVAAVCERMDVTSNCILDLDDKETMCALAGAISHVENGVEPVDEEVEGGWELL